MILSYHAVPTEEEMFFISRPLLPSSSPDFHLSVFFRGAILYGI